MKKFAFNSHFYWGCNFNPTFKKIENGLNKGTHRWSLTRGWSYPREGVAVSSPQELSNLLREAPTVGFLS